MATHRPQDLNDLVIELANTKIAFRSDRETLKRIDMEEYSEMLENAPPGLGVIKTFAYKVLDLEFRTEPI
jgi:DNA helicase HerA-like ATPase